MSIIVCIAGGSGSGKSTLARNLIKSLPDSVLIPHDDYYKTPSPPSTDFNYDEPDAFETDLLIKHLDMLISGISVDAPLYDYSLHRRSVEKRHLAPAKVIIVEGILALENEELRKRANLKIFVDTSEKERLKRRIRRDERDRGRTKESVICQFEKTVKPMHEMYVEPEKTYADITVKNGGKDRKALKAICQIIENLLKN